MTIPATTTLLIKSLVVKALLLGIVVAVVQFVAPPGSGDIVPVHDPWFDIFLVWMLFSAITAGMPEPTKEKGDNYLWAYRSMHILSASGTSYFRNKLIIPTEVTPSKEVKELEREGEI